MMIPGRFFWKLFLGNLALMALLPGICVWLVIAEWERFHTQELTSHLRSYAAALVPMVKDRFEVADAPALDRLAQQWGSSAPDGIRVTFFMPDGTLLGDSSADSPPVELEANHPEIGQAFAEGWGESTRWSRVRSREMRYVAVRVGPAKRPHGVVRVASTGRSLGSHIQSARNSMWLIALAALFAAVGSAFALAWLLSRRISRVTATAGSD